MNVKVKLHNGYEYEIPVNYDTTCEQLKHQIKNIMDFMPTEQIMIFNQTELSNPNGKLITYGIKHGSVINLTFKLKKFTVFVGRQDGTSTNISVSSEDNVQELKEKILALWNIPIEQQTLLFKHETLENNKKLSEYGIVKECLISVFPKVSKLQDSVKTIFEIPNKIETELSLFLKPKHPSEYPNSSIQVNRWFHHISGVDSEKLLLERGTNGSFLARPSYSSPGSFTLSVRRGNEVTHIKIQNTDDFLDLYGGEKFATLPELVGYYMQDGKELKEKNGQIIELKYPLSSVDPTTERWFHGDINGKEAERMLIDKGRNGSFLVRESMRKIGSYVVSVLTGDHVDHVMIYCRENKKFDIGGGRQFDTLKDLIDFYVTTPMVEKSGTLVSLIHPFNATRVNVLSIKERMSQLEKNNGRGPNCQPGFLEEFDELQQDARSKNLTREEGFKSYNADKNRYRNILPFDVNRVKLKDGDPNIPGSDYINANYIKWPYENDNNDYIYDNNQVTLRYIATQGTLENTVVDFWRMVWQEESNVIVMITKEVEKGKNKCVRYWPTKEEGKLVFDTYQARLIVTYVAEHPNDTFILRQLFLRKVSMKDGCNDKNPEGFNVFHYHFMVWPDHGTPKDPSSLLSFMEECSFQKRLLRDSGPIIVHCSAGIGRSGTFIAIDILINQIRGDLNKDIDILRTVQIIRDQRSGMVQTETQYRFVYMAVKEFIYLEKNRLQNSNEAKRSGREYTNLKGFPDVVTNIPNMSNHINVMNISPETNLSDFQSHPPSTLPRNAIIHPADDRRTGNAFSTMRPPLPMRKGECD